jgi:hypothetical protein
MPALSSTLLRWVAVAIAMAIGVLVLTSVSTHGSSNSVPSRADFGWTAVKPLV